MNLNNETPPENSYGLWFGAVLAAIGASVCCVGPLVLLSFGIGGAWISSLTAMETFRPFFIIVTLIFIGLGFHKLYWPASRCEVSGSCSSTSIQRRQRILFWSGSMLVLMILTFPWFAPYFMA